MVRVPVYSLLALLMGAMHVSAATFCRCQNDNGNVNGINEVCSQLDENWCSTDCWSGRSSCYTCQYTPEGTGDDESYKRLKAWCGRHDNGVVNCYSRDNLRSPGLLYQAGCDYSSTSPLNPSVSGPTYHQPDSERKAKMTVVFAANPSTGIYSGQDAVNCKDMPQSRLADASNQFMYDYKICKVRSQSQFGRNIGCPLEDLKSVQKYFKKHCPEWQKEDTN
ncbi:hypothetical protein BDV25DRAFT_65887 [Aspergillus avenaceus]|uniref:Secreted protein n=1 Tax=Aspergillus avenaceus TaxID=36643 RepID=A0A5N6TH95_ASPAV|nr:hypothetical protein BDV25DRAFT_65887 [Aspergillus avenaceus]